MIKVENVDVWGFEHAIRGMRNPMNSWSTSDSLVSVNRNGKSEFVLGSNDQTLMRRLYRAGTEHRKYLRQIMVSFDVIAPLYWWKEFDTYKVGTVANSCSTMHKISAKKFEPEDFSYEHIFIFMPVRKEETSYKIDNRLTYTNNGPLNYGKLDLVKVIGTYLSYRKVYVSSDKKSFKVEYVRYEPIDAPYDSEAQGNYAFHIAKGDEIEYINTFSTNEVIEVDRKFEFEYMVMF